MKMFAATERLAGPEIPIVRLKTAAKARVMILRIPQCQRIADSDPMTMISGNN